MTREQIRDFVNEFRQSAGDAGYFENARYLLQSVSDLTFHRHDFRNNLISMMNRVPVNRDRREGSIIYDALYPTAEAHRDMAETIEIHKDQMRLMTSMGESLDHWGATFQLPRHRALRAIRIAVATWRTSVLEDAPSIPTNALFITVGMDRPIRYRFIGTDMGRILLECEEEGYVGNLHVGEIVPTMRVNNLTRIELAGTFRPGQDDETDERFRRRLIRHLTRQRYGGNVYQYINWMTAQEIIHTVDTDYSDGRAGERQIVGIGECVVFPAPRGGGSVRISLVDTQGNPVDKDYLADIQYWIHPPYQGPPSVNIVIDEDSAPFIYAAGFGISPIAHHVEVLTPEWININVEITISLDAGIEIGMVEADIYEAIRRYIETVKQGWEYAWYSTWSRGTNISLVFDEGYLTPRRSHSFELRISRALINSAILGIGSIRDLDENLTLINGEPRAVLPIPQNEWEQFLPRLQYLTINVVENIDHVTPGLPPDVILRQKFYISLPGAPVIKLTEMESIEP